MLSTGCISGYRTLGRCMFHLLGYGRLLTAGCVVKIDFEVVCTGREIYPASSVTSSPLFSCSFCDRYA